MNGRMILRLFAGFALVLALFASAPHAHAASPAVPTPTMSPLDLLDAIRAKFRTHRPPPPFETYTYDSKGNTNYGEPDYAGNETFSVWYRSSDHAALTRRTTELGYVGNPEFKRTLFNAAIEPGPPTADVFEPAPLRTHPPDFVPTPEPTLDPKLKVLVTVKARSGDYRVISVDREGDELHLKVQPTHDPMRNRLRELWVDAQTLELRKLVATDILFMVGPHQGFNDTYPMLFTYYFSTLDGIPVITHLHGIVLGGYDADESIVDIQFKDLNFPQELPDWYFDPHAWGQHKDQWPDPPDAQ